MESILGKCVGSQYIAYSNASCMTVHIMKMQNPLEVRALWESWIDKLIKLINEWNDMRKEIQKCFPKFEFVHE